MSAILPAISIDSTKAESRYFLPYQLVWIVDDSQLRLVKKSVRIGWTYGDSFKNVRKRLRHAKRDYLFATKDQSTAFEYVEQCYRFCEIYKLTKSVLARGTANPQVGWSVIQRCQADYSIERMHVEARDIEKLVGKYDRATALNRAHETATVIKAAFSKLLATPGQYTVGFDVAASGEGDLACIYVDEVSGGLQTLRGLLTARVGDDWPFLKAALYTFLDELSAVTGAGDETGLGRQICREAALDFPGQFHCVNFRSEKSDLGTVLINQLAATEKVFPKNQPDIAQDIFSVSKVWNGSKWIFTEGRNMLNPHSHCDINWAACLSSKAKALYRPVVTGLEMVF